MGPRSWSRGRLLVPCQLSVVSCTGRCSNGATKLESWKTLSPLSVVSCQLYRTVLQWGHEVGVVEDPTDNGQLTTDEGSFNGATKLESWKTQRTTDN